MTSLHMRCPVVANQGQLQEDCAIEPDLTALCENDALGGAVC